MDIESCVEAYYEALRNGDPLGEFFVEEPDPVKFGITEALHGYEEIDEALREQTRTTSDWTVTSHRLECDRAGDVGWFSDLVTMGWRDEKRNERVAWETRWSGTLLRRSGRWKFVRMHVSAAADSSAG